MLRRTLAGCGTDKNLDERGHSMGQGQQRESELDDKLSVLKYISTKVKVVNGDILERLGLDITDEVVSSFIAKENITVSDEMVIPGYISSEEFKLLIVRAKAGETEATHRIITAYTPAVKKYVGAKMVYGKCNALSEYEDLCQQAVLGLYDAIKKFDPEKHNCFWTYAKHYVKKHINSLMYEGGTIKISRGIMHSISRLTTIQSEYKSKNNKEPDVYELAEIMGESEYKIRELLKMMDTLTDPNIKSTNDNNVYLEQFSSNAKNELEDNLIKQEEHKVLHSAIDRLSSDEKLILLYRYGLNDFEPMKWGDVSKIVKIAENNLKFKNRHILAVLRNEMLKYYYPETYKGIYQLRLKEKPDDVDV